MVLKQSLPYVRTDHSWAVPQDRIFAEARGYEAAARTSPGATPRYFGLDADRRVIAIEDLSSWTVWRTALNEGRITPGAGADLGRYVARLAFGTSAFGACRRRRCARGAAGALNIELCRITEDLVFTEPFRDHEHNGWDAAVTPAVLALRDDAVLAEVAELKWRFLDRRGGAHPRRPAHRQRVRGAGGAARCGGRIVAKAFDLEFGVYGPIAFDLGALFGNFLLAQSRAAALERPADVPRLGRRARGGDLGRVRGRVPAAVAAAGRPGVHRRVPRALARGDVAPGRRVRRHQGRAAHRRLGEGVRHPVARRGPARAAPRAPR